MLINVSAPMSSLALIANFHTAFAVDGHLVKTEGVSTKEERTNAYVQRNIRGHSVNLNSINVRPTLAKTMECASMAHQPTPAYVNEGTVERTARST